MLTTIISAVRASCVRATWPRSGPRNCNRQWPRLSQPSAHCGSSRLLTALGSRPAATLQDLNPNPDPARAGPRTRGRRRKLSQGERRLSRRPAQPRRQRRAQPGGHRCAARGPGRRAVRPRRQWARRGRPVLWRAVRGTWRRGGSGGVRQRGRDAPGCQAAAGGRRGRLRADGGGRLQTGDGGRVALRTLGSDALVETSMHAVSHTYKPVSAREERQSWCKPGIRAPGCASAPRRWSPTVAAAGAARARLRKVLRALCERQQRAQRRVAGEAAGAARVRQARADERLCQRGRLRRVRRRDGAQRRRGRSCRTRTAASARPPHPT
jgi:hypothetical protein